MSERMGAPDLHFFTQKVCADVRRRFGQLGRLVAWSARRKINVPGPELASSPTFCGEAGAVIQMILVIGGVKGGVLVSDLQAVLTPGRRRCGGSSEVAPAVSLGRPSPTDICGSRIFRQIRR